MRQRYLKCTILNEEWGKCHFIFSDPLNFHIHIHFLVPVFFFCLLSMHVIPIALHIQSHRRQLTNSNCLVSNRTFSCPFKCFATYKKLFGWLLLSMRNCFFSVFVDNTLHTEIMRCVLDVLGAFCVRPYTIFFLSTSHSVYCSHTHNFSLTINRFVIVCKQK